MINPWGIVKNARPTLHPLTHQNGKSIPLPAEPFSMQIYSLRPSPLVHSPLITDPRHRRPNRRIQSQRSTYSDARLAFRALQDVPQEAVDGRPAGDEGCKR